VHDLDEFLGRESLRRVASCFGIYHVFANVVLDNLRDETIQRAATGGRLLQHRGTFIVRIDRVGYLPHPMDPQPSTPTLDEAQAPQRAALPPFDRPDRKAWKRITACGF
jgi:hypothetical protein